MVNRLSNKKIKQIDSKKIKQINSDILKYINRTVGEGYALVKRKDGKDIIRLILKDVCLDIYVGGDLMYWDLMYWVSFSSLYKKGSSVIFGKYNFYLNEKNEKEKKYLFPGDNFLRIFIKQNLKN